MHRLTLMATACALAVAAVLAGTQVGAQQTNLQERTFLTFSHSVELPGVTLEPGTYEFRLADTPSRNVVQVFRKDAKDVIGQWTYVQSQRPRVSEETVVMFRETEENTRPAIQYWYYPGESIGKEFVYPEDQAKEIAERTGQPVLTEDGPVQPSAQARAAADTAARRPQDDRASATEGIDRGLTREARAAIRNAPAAAWPSAPAGSTAGFRGAPSSADDDSERQAADFDRDEQQAAARRPAPAPAAPRAEPAARADDQVSRNDTARDAPASAQPTAPAGSTAGSRGVDTEPSAQADVSAADEDRADGAADPPALNRQEPAGERPVGTSGSADAAQQPGAPADELPRTASPLPLAGLIGLLALAGAAGLRALRR